MKIIRYLIACSLLSLLVISCEKGLDPIITVNPKPDVTAPEVTITYPEDGTNVISTDSIATITLKAVAEDDVELKSVVLKINDVEVANYTEFIDYRRLDLKYDQGGFTDGDYTLTVIVTDLTDKSVTQSISFHKITAPPYTAMDGEVLYFSFDGFYLDLISKNAATVTGAPSFVSGKTNLCMQGATDSYVEYPTTGLLGDEFSVAFWYKLNDVPDRAGILAISQPTDPAAADRTKGFRLFREISGGKQNIGLNIGITSTEVWMNPFVQLDPGADWVHIAISISTTNVTIYINGVPNATVTELASKIDWTGCTSMTIGSGMPNFVYWLHYSDLSLYDEFHMFNKAISAAEVQSLYTAKK